MQTFRSVIAFAVACSGAVSLAAEKFLLTEDSSSDVIRAYESRITGEGTLEFHPGPNADQPVTHPIKMVAAFRFAERRLPAAGRDDAAWRSIRQYDEAKSQIDVGGQTSLPSLRPERRTLVVTADRAGLLPYSPDGPLSSREVELLPSLGDPLLLAALLPDREVGVAESWTPPTWIGPAIAGTEVSFNSELTCRLLSVAQGLAKLSFDGKVSGATKGSTTETSLSGEFEFDLNTRAIVSAEVSQSEKRSIGPVTPGMTLTLKAKVRKAADIPSDAISSVDVASIPLRPAVEDLTVEHTLPFSALLKGERDWLAVQQNGQLLVLRLLDHGGIVAQCNIAPAPKVLAGERTDERQFQADIRRTLGEQLSEIVTAEEVVGIENHRVYRVTALGKAEDTDMIWRYYLVAAPDGRQAAFAFTIEASQLPRLGERDVELVKGIQFADQSAPQTALPRPRQ